MEIKTKTRILVLAAALLLSGCGVTPKTSSEGVPTSNPADESSQTVNPSSSKADEGEAGVIEVTTDLTKEFNIHTAEQQAYLDYQGDYSTINPDLYPNGSTSISDPVAVKLEWTHGEAEGKTLKNYSVILGQKADLSDGYEHKGTKAKKLDVYNSYIGKNYFKVVANYTDGSKDETAILEYTVKNNGPRNLKVGNMTNCRDLGGRVTEDGGKIKQGLIFRTCGNNYNMRGLTYDEEAKTTFIDELKVKTEINVSNDDSYNFSFQGVKLKKFYMDYGGSANHHLSRNAESVKNYFNYLADENNYPVFYHCRIGTDRTGLCTIMTLGLLGVSENTIYQDYLFSNFGAIGEKRYIGEKAGQDNIKNYMAEINRLSGKTFKNKVYNFLLTIGVTKENLDKVIGILTEGQQAKDNDAGQIVATAEKLTLGGGATLVTKANPADNERANPINYVTMAKDATASYSFNVSTAGNAQIVAYVGNNQNSTAKKISDALECTIDGQPVSVTTASYKDSCMGNVNNRTNYYPVILGTSELTAGDHTIELKGKTSTSTDYLKLGTIALFGAAGSGSTGGNTGGNGGGTGGDVITHAHSWSEPTTVSEGYTKSTCVCGAEKLSIVALNSSTQSKNKSGTPAGYLKLANGDDEVSWTFAADKAMSGDIYFDSIMDSWNNGNQNNNFYSVKTASHTNGNFELKVNGTAVDFSWTRDLKYSDMYANGTDTGLGSSYSGRAEVKVGAVNIQNGPNTITLKRIDSYNPLLKNLVIIAE
ncbi:MAG: tyrosine-protein phosphatase [Candidatus Enteromonas sp.]|nr:tyrosine-protein phosphatase [Candidatus Enteromonas sp.]